METHYLTPCGNTDDPNKTGYLCVSKEIKEEYPSTYDNYPTCTGYDPEKYNTVVTLDNFRDYKCCNEEQFNI